MTWLWKEAAAFLVFGEVTMNFKPVPRATLTDLAHFKTNLDHVSDSFTVIFEGFLFLVEHSRFGTFVSAINGFFSYWNIQRFGTFVSPILTSFSTQLRWFLKSFCSTWNIERFGTFWAQSWLRLLVIYSDWLLFPVEHSKNCDFFSYSFTVI